MKLDELPGAGANKEYHVDFCFNRDNYTVSRWVDGVELASVTIPTGELRNNIDNGFFLVEPFLLNAGAGNSRFAYRDMVIYDDIREPGNEISSRRGKLKVLPMTIQSVVGDNWTSQSGGPAEDELNSVGGNTSLTSPKPATPLNVVFDVDLPAGHRIAAVTALGGMSFTEGDVSPTVEVEWVRGAVKAEKPAIANMIKTTRHGYHFGVMATAPGGLAWTPELLNGTVLKLVPLED